MPGAPDAPAPRDTFFEHSNTAKWWVSGQANFVFQAHGDFYAAYSGPNSLKDTSEHATSRVLTLFTGYEFTPNSILYLDVEEAGWGGISGALGLAGFTNLDVVRNPQVGTAPYIARLMFQQIIPFSKEKDRNSAWAAHAWRPRFRCADWRFALASSRWPISSTTTSAGPTAITNS